MRHEDPGPALMDIYRSPAEDDELDVLATLVEVYEDRHFPMDLPDPVEAIRLYMEQSGMTQSDIALIIGSPARRSPKCSTASAT